MTLVERVARRICGTHEMLEHGKDSDDGWPTWLGTARTAIEAMREPTPAMLEAVRAWSYAKYGKPIGHDAATGCWQAMLDAALKELGWTERTVIDKPATPPTSANLGHG